MKSIQILLKILPFFAICHIAFALTGQFKRQMIGFSFTTSFLATNSITMPAHSYAQCVLVCTIDVYCMATQFSDASKLCYFFATLPNFQTDFVSSSAADAIYFKKDYAISTTILSTSTSTSTSTLSQTPSTYLFILYTCNSS